MSGSLLFLPQLSSAQLPHLEKRGNATQLIVGGKPHLALACELKNSSASSAAYMAPIWPKLKEAGLNTVLAVVGWEQVEPEEGVYDFTVVDELIRDARAYDQKLVLLWFGSWKNGFSSYQPAWVKADQERFPLVQTAEGRSIPILSTFGKQTRELDAKALAAMMKHIKAVDSEENTVIMVQVENEVGIHGQARDYRPEAQKAFEGQVPKELIGYLKKNNSSLKKEVLSAWERNGGKAKGSWAEVFGNDATGSEIFTAWQYASYMDYMAAAGKAEYDIPMFVNAWLVQPGDVSGGDYPSGGPQAHNLDIWRAAASHIDMFCPDIYLPDFPGIMQQFAVEGSPIFVPESRAAQGGAANAAYAIGESAAIGYSPFGFDSGTFSEANAPFIALYKQLGSIEDRILKAQEDGSLRAAWVSGSKPEWYASELNVGDYIIRVEITSSGRTVGGAPSLVGGTTDANASGYAMVFQESEDEFLFLASNVTVSFRPKDEDGVVGLAKVVEGSFAGGEWVPGRWLNGDETQLRYDISSALKEGYSGQGLSCRSNEPVFIRVKLYEF